MIGVMRTLGRALPLRPAHVKLWSGRRKVVADQTGWWDEGGTSIASEDEAVFLLEMYLQELFPFS